MQVCFVASLLIECLNEALGDLVYLIRGVVIDFLHFQLNWFVVLRDAMLLNYLVVGSLDRIVLIGLFQFRRKFTVSFVYEIPGGDQLLLERGLFRVWGFVSLFELFGVNGVEKAAV